MGNRIIVCGGNGAGKSTLGEKLSRELEWSFMDIEDYYFPFHSMDYNYELARTREEVSSLLLEDFKRYDNFVFSSVKGNYGEEVSTMFTCAVLVSVPKEIRMKRVRDRSYKKFGDRILQGGDLYEKEKNFFDMVEQRSDDDVTTWLESTNIPIIRVDGTQPIDRNIQTIGQILMERKC